MSTIEVAGGSGGGGFEGATLYRNVGTRALCSVPDWLAQHVVIDVRAETVAVGRVPGRTDGLASLHVGDRYVEMSAADLERLVADIVRLL